MPCPCCNPCSGPCDGENPCPEGCACVDGECVTSCPVECGANGDCGSQCECCTTWSYTNPGFLVQGCRRASEGYACCCESYKSLCYTDMSYCVGAEDGPAPNIAGSPPANAIVLINSSGVYCDVNREVEGYHVYGEEGGENCYNYGYYTAVSDCGACEGTCAAWFDTSLFSPSFWQIFCDCATSNSVDACAENPLP
jgi:hypothetical protein